MLVIHEPDKLFTASRYNRSRDFTADGCIDCPGSYGRGAILNFGVLGLTKKADSMLLLRAGAGSITLLFGLSNDLDAVSGLEPCRRS